MRIDNKYQIFQIFERLFINEKFQKIFAKFVKKIKNINRIVDCDDDDDDDNDKNDDDDNDKKFRFKFKKNMKNFNIWINFKYVNELINYNEKMKLICFEFLKFSKMRNEHTNRKCEYESFYLK